MEAAGSRHQEGTSNLATMTEQNHRQEVAQLTGEAARALDEQACIYVNDTDRLRREAAANHDEITHYISTGQAAEKPTRDVHAEMMRACSCK